MNLNTGRKDCTVFALFPAGQIKTLSSVPSAVVLPFYICNSWERVLWRFSIMHPLCASCHSLSSCAWSSSLVTYNKLWLPFNAWSWWCIMNFPFYLSSPLLSHFTASCPSALLPRPASHVTRLHIFEWVWVLLCFLLSFNLDCISPRVQNLQSWLHGIQVIESSHGGHFLALG